MNEQTLHFQVNGQEQQICCAVGASLLSALHQQGCMGVHRVCDSGDCGSCTVWVNDVAVHSCIFPAFRAEGTAVTTIEGLAQGASLTPMQRAFLEKQGFQCGYCTPGMIMSATKLVERPEVVQAEDPDAAIRNWMDGNLCRCTGYQAIAESILAGGFGFQAEVSPGLAESGCQVGRSIPKQDGPAIVTGQPIYTADWVPAGTLHLKVLRSPHAHALIRRIDTTKAQTLPGVHVVLTHADVPRIPYTTAGHGEPVPDPHDHYLLDNKVRFVGDRVAAVVADSVAIAEQACGLIEVDYEVLPHVLDPLAAMGDRAVDLGFPPDAASTKLSSDSSTRLPLLHDEPDSFQIHDAQHNIAGEVRLEKGNLERGWAEADFTLERIYQVPAVQHFHLEPHVSTSWLEADGTLVVRSATQVPFHCQRVLAQLFDLPKEKVRVFKTHLGGGFGNKQEILTEDLCALATLKTGRPVQWQFTRWEEMTATNSRHAAKIRLKVGVKRDGTLTAMEMAVAANTGAYGNHGTQVVFLTGSMPLGLYRCENQRYLGRSVYTNTMPGGAFRGYGATQGFFAMECLMDEVAIALQLDPLELRRRQLIQPSAGLLLGADHHFHLIGSYGLQEALDQVQQRLQHTPAMPPSRTGQDSVGQTRRGIGFAVAMQGSGLAKIHEARVRLALQPNGRYLMRTGSVDLGTGSDTTLRQIAAEVLHTTIDQIDIITADTKETPFDAGAYASATTYITGQAVLLAAQDLRSHLLNRAVEMVNIPVEQMDLQGDCIVSKNEVSEHENDPSLLITLETLAHQQNGVIEVERHYAADASTLTFAVQGVEVEVDLETGKVSVLKAVQAVDIGKAINPRICEGQIIGGMAMGLGYALTEELRLNEQGQTLNPTPRTYRLPLAKDMPKVEVVLVERRDPYGPLGAKGVGEVSVNGMAPAIANAVAHATGVRLYQLPMTPERVWAALRSRHSSDSSACNRGLENADLENDA